MSSPFEYQPLNREKREIRLLTLYPDAWNKPISCSLQIVSLDDNPSYRALSYVWGNPKITHPILLHNQPFDATVNLTAALRRLRDEIQPLVLWVDAICINQKDTNERSNQVSIMGDIYKTTSEVIVWLGEGDDASYLLRFDESRESVTTMKIEEQTEDQTLSTELGRGLNLQEDNFSLDSGFIQNVTRAFYILFQLSQDKHAYSLPMMTQRSEDPAYVISNGHEGCVRVLESIAKRSWWQRVWTVQEILFPPHAVFYYDFACIPWPALVEAAQHYAQHQREHQDYLTHQLEPSLSTALWSIYRRVAEIESTRWLAGDFNLFEVYTNYRTRLATEPSDMIFALLSLCSGPVKELPNVVTKSVLPPQIDINYSLDYHIIYRQFAWLWIQTSRSLDVLMFTGEQHRDAELPTWVPDWRAKPLPDTAASTLMRPRMLAFQKNFRASGEYEAEANHDGSLWLKVRGIYIDSVSIPNEGASRNEESYPAGGSFRDAFWRTMVLDHIELSTGLRRTIPTDEDLFMKYWEGMRSEDHSVIPAEYEQSFGDSITAGDCRELFISDRGYMGSAPMKLQPGDEIYILYGCRVPMVLRPYLSKDIDKINAESRDRIIVSPCYVHGIMDGEALGEPHHLNCTITLY
jgi:hypothetical protein